LLAHALLDLMDLPSLLPLLWRLLKPGGLAYFTLNFDAGTVFLPERPELDEDFLLDRYHASMDNRTIQGRPGGSSRTGRSFWKPCMMPCGKTPRCRRSRPKYGIEPA